MPFTNVWDDTFPPDTQLANQLGLDLRNFRLDTQQRMAAISGLDAAKPNFAADAQPANWVGILFFATDTGRIYQFANPAWNDITSSFQTSGTRKIFQDSSIHNHTGTVTLDDIYTIALPTFGAGDTIRIQLFFAVAAQGGPNTTIRLYDQLHTDLLVSDSFTSGGLSSGSFDAEYRVFGPVATQVVTIYRRIGTGIGSNLLNIGTGSGSAAPTSLILSVQSGSVTDHQQFGPVVVEFIP